MQYNTTLFHFGLPIFESENRDAKRRFARIGMPRLFQRPLSNQRAYGKMKQTISTKNQALKITSKAYDTRAI